MDTPMIVETPLMWLSKAQTWQMAEDLGGADFLALITESTHTCYAGDRSQRHPWGYGCGQCPACDLRRRGWETYSAQAHPAASR
jgi:7-cyano-7-deazaguanine synthase